MFHWGIEREGTSGTYNATGPTPVTNAVFMRALRRAVRRPWSPPTPAPLVRVGAFFMRTEPSLALTGRRCVPARFAAQGFTFAHPDLDETLRDALAKGASVRR
jgi:NAD dependent epimerase/dehydratase family enzyme